MRRTPLSRSPLKGRRKKLRGSRYVKGFRQAADERWLRVQGDLPWGACEACGCIVPRETVPHHIRGAEGGMGGKRIHRWDLLRHLCGACHEGWEREGR